MDTKKIGAFIAMNRKKKGLTQEQLGEKLGVSNKTISRWENGNYMPDLSLLQPLSKELDISLNELLSGEKIEKEKAIEYSEKNLTETIDYSTKKIKNEHQKISLFLILLGALICFYAFNGLPSNSNFGIVFLLFGLCAIIVGVFREFKFSSFWKTMFASVGLFFILFFTFLFVDYLRVCELRQPPLFRYTTITNLEQTKIIEYKNWFYHVYQINANTPNEYLIIDTKKTYTIDTVPISPFNREISGINNIIKYKNPYIGNNSNTGNLLYSLPLSEYGFVFEIDADNRGLIIDYHTTDWYHNEDFYIDKALVYNTVSTFCLIDNLEYIQFNFSGSTYSITRDTISQNYPHFEKILTNSGIDQENFNLYVEQKMNDNAFVQDMMTYFNKQ